MWIHQSGWKEQPSGKRVGHRPSWCTPTDGRGRHLPQLGIQQTWGRCDHWKRKAIVLFFLKGGGGPVRLHRRGSIVAIRPMLIVPCGHQGDVLNPTRHFCIFALFVRFLVNPGNPGDALLLTIFTQLNGFGFCVRVLGTRETPGSPKCAIPGILQFKRDL